MDNNKGQTIFLSVIGVATLLVAIIGATFAWFSATISGNDNASSVVVTTAVLGSVVFTDGDQIVLENIKPDNNAQGTKSFTIANTETTATEVIPYEIYLDVTTNTLTPAADGQFVYTLTGTKTGEGALATDVAETAVPTARTKIGTGSLKGYETHTYTFTIHFKESNSDQNAAQGKAFAGRIQVTQPSA